MQLGTKQPVSLYIYMAGATKKKNTSSNSILWPTPKGSAMIDIIFSYSLLRLADVLAVIRHFLFDKNI